MKKLSFIILLLGTILLCFISCNSTPTGTTETSGEEGHDPNESVYEVLDRLSKASYQKLQLTVTTGEGENELISTYTVTENEVTYRIERFAEFIPGAELPESRIIVQSGTATVKEGKVTAINGDPVNLPAINELTGKNFHFEEADFSDVTESSGCFTAKVKDPAAWLSTDKAVENATLEVLYTEKKIEKILICYDISKTPVRTEYQFFVD